MLTLQASRTDQTQVGLSIRGEMPTCPLVAIIGTREPTSEATEAAFVAAKLLAQVGIGVVSGLALGIDGAAHRGCLAGGGRTVAVLGHGLEAPLYPPQHTALAEAITQRGALVSSFSLEASVTRQGLLARNGWIARLAVAVWVVQSGVPGGALAAAAYARAAGIPVLTSAWDEGRWHQGFQSLVRHGAVPIEAMTAATTLESYCHGRRRQSQGVLAM